MDQAEKLRTMFKDKQNETIKSSSLKTISITSGKGGVGKTNVTLNVAIQLTKLGKKVIILDADLGLANIELLMGISPKYTLEDLIRGRKSIDEILTVGPCGIQFISGGSGVTELIRISDSQLSFFIQNISKLDKIADIILIDTGAGVSNSVLNFVKSTDEIIVVVTPDPSSIMDSYSLIRVLKNDNIDIPKINIVANRVDNEKEAIETFERISRATTKFLDVDLYNLGYIPYDSYLIKAVKKQEPVTVLYPKSLSSEAFYNIANKILDSSYEGTLNKGISSFIKRLISTFNS